MNREVAELRKQTWNSIMLYVQTQEHTGKRTHGQIDTRTGHTLQSRQHECTLYKGIKTESNVSFCFKRGR